MNAVVDPMPARMTSARLQEPPRAMRPHQGMPPLGHDGPPLSFFEFWPMWAFYPPVMAYAAWLMLRYRGVLLPTVARKEGWGQALKRALRLGGPDTNERPGDGSTQTITRHDDGRPITA